MVLDAYSKMPATMKVKEFMIHPPVYSCGQDTSLPEAAKIMKDANCGMLPVLSRYNKVIGVITDRDICLALAGTYGRDLYKRRIGDISDGEVYSIGAEEDIEDALVIMRTRGVSRVPVLSEDGCLAGILSVNDILLRIVEFDKNGKSEGQDSDGYEALYRTLSSLIRRDDTVPGMKQKNDNSFEVY